MEEINTSNLNIDTTFILMENCCELEENDLIIHLYLVNSFQIKALSENLR